MKVKVLVILWCLTLYNPMDCRPPGSLSMEFSRQEYWSGLPFPSPGDLPDPGIKPRSPALQAASLPSEPAGKPMDIFGRPLFSEHGIQLDFCSIWWNGVPSGICQQPTPLLICGVISSTRRSCIHTDLILTSHFCSIASTSIGVVLVVVVVFNFGFIRYFF